MDGPEQDLADISDAHQTPVALIVVASVGVRPRIRSEPLSAIIMVEALRLAESSAA
jgi:hypothetical protein